MHDRASSGYHVREKFRNDNVSQLAFVASDGDGQKVLVKHTVYYRGQAYEILNYGLRGSQA